MQPRTPSDGGGASLRVPPRGRSPGLNHPGERNVVRCGPREHGQSVRPIAPNLANVKVPGQAAPQTAGGTLFPHSGWNLDGQASLYEHGTLRPLHSCTSTPTECRLSSRMVDCQRAVNAVSESVQASQTAAGSDEIAAV